MKLFRLIGSFLLLVICGGASAQVKPIPFDNYISNGSGLLNSRYVMATKKTITIAFLGGSITYNPGWRNAVGNYLKTKYPQTKFRFIAAGIPSLGSLPHVFRLQRDVLDSGKVDLLFLEAAVNDQVNGTDSVTQVKSLEGIVRHARQSNPYMDIVMLSFADPDKTRLYQQGQIPVSVANHALVSGHYKLPHINLAKAVSDKLANKEFSWEKDFVDLHPSPFGQQLYFNPIKQLFDEEFSRVVKIYNYKKHRPVKELLNEGSFTKGSYLDIKNAILGSGWSYDANWKPIDHIGVRDGFVNVPMLVSTTAAASLSIKFKGNAIGMAIVSGADAGIVEYSIDGGQKKQLDLFTQWSNSLHLPWYVLFDNELAKGKHELKLTISSGKNKSSKGTACRIVYFLVNN
ncbi:MAG: SGNH/GDSL hydrolase family protein [Bacteroidota bacterium]